MKLNTIWIVIYPHYGSTLNDICFEVGPSGFAHQVRGGLDPDDIHSLHNGEPSAHDTASGLLARAASRAYEEAQELLPRVAKE